MTEPTVARTYEWDFFLAHASADKSLARELYGHLSPHARVFLDEISIPPGGDWDLELAKAQRSSRVTVALISSHFERAYYLREEIILGVALARHAPAEHTVVPVYVEEAGWDALPPYGLNSKQGIKLREVGGPEAVAHRLLNRSETLSDDHAIDSPPSAAHYLHQFPCGPMVPGHMVKRSLIEAYATTIPASRAASVLDEAVAARLEADPYDPTVTYIKHAHVVPPETTAPITYWLNVFTEARLHGPRMLAALLSVTDDSRFPAEAKESRRRLLEQLRAAR